MKTKRVVVASVAAFGVVAVTACGSSTNSSAPSGSASSSAASNAATPTGGATSPVSGETIKIGFLDTLSGAASDVGETALEGAEIAVDEINGNGGIDGRKLELVKKDEKLSPSATVQAMREFANEGVKLITGFTSSADAIAAIPVAEENGMVIVTAGTTATELTTTKFSKNLFEVASNTYMMNAAAAKLAVTEWKDVTQWNNIGFDYLTGHNSWDEFQKLVSAESSTAKFGKAVFYPLDAKQVTTYVTAMLGSKPDPNSTGLFISTFGGGAVTFAKQALPYQLFDKFKIVANVGGGEELAAALGADSPKIYYIHDYFYGAYDNDINKRLIAEWEKRPKVGPPTYGPHAWLYEGYTGVMAFANALKIAKSDDPAKLLETLPGMKFDTAMGPAYFRAEDHILVAPVSAVECVGDKSAKLGYTCSNAKSIPGESVVAPPNPAKS